MNWPLAIERNRTALLVIAAAIAAMLAHAGGGLMPRRLRNGALALLRPAESALRRLIVIAARGLAVASRAHQRSPFSRLIATGAAASGRPPAFPLFDRRKRFAPLFRPAIARGVPRIRTFWGAPLILSPEPVEGSKGAPRAARSDPDALVDIARLSRRLQSLEAALADLPRQAKRLARWRAKQRNGQEGRSAARQPMRPGGPPGHRRRPNREVDLVLRECHALALDALRPDTS